MPPSSKWFFNYKSSKALGSVCSSRIPYNNTWDSPAKVKLSQLVANEHKMKRIKFTEWKNISTSDAVHNMKSSYLAKFNFHFNISSHNSLQPCLEQKLFPCSNPNKGTEKRERFTSMTLKLYFIVCSVSYSQLYWHWTTPRKADVAFK